MWILAAATAILVLALAFFRFRQRAEAPSETPRTDMEVSTEIGVPPEEIDPSKAGQADRHAGVTLPRIPPPRQDRDDGSLRSASLRKTDLPKEVELAWEAGGLIEFQKGAWAVPKDPSEYSGQEAQDEPIGPKPVEHKPTEDKSVAHKPLGTTMEEPYTLPQRYGFDRLVLIARDPNWVYAYWEITHEKYRQMYEKYLRDWGLSRPVLRIYDLTSGPDRRKAMDVFISDRADNWYINISKPRHTLMAELGRLFPENNFVSFLTSNVITLPADTLSDMICPEWPPIGWPEGYPESAAKIGISSPMNRGKGADG